MPDPQATRPDPDLAFRRRTAFAIFLALLFGTLLAAAWALRTMLLMLFMAAILAVILRRAGVWLSARTGLKPRWAVMSIALLGVLALVGAAAGAGATLVTQARQLAERLPAAAEAAQKRIGDHPWLSDLWSRLREGLSLPDPGDAVGQAGAILGAASSALGYVGLALVGALFLALEPTLYRKGVLKLVPTWERDFTARLLDELEETTLSWVGGQLVLMAAIGTLVGLGLWLIGVPYALALGVLAGLLEFIPYLGPILSSTPALLLALTVGPATAGWTLLLIFLVQEAENNILQPMVQKSSVAIPPVLLLVVLFGMGQIFGVAGLIAATPLLALALVAVRRVYVERILEGRDGTAKPAG